jgi:hypothetical protein
MPRTLIIILFLFCTGQVFAQAWEIGGTLGGAGYLGDLNQRNMVKVSGVSAGGFIKRNFNGYLSAKVAYNYGRIAGADSTSGYQQFRDRNLSFSTKLNEVSLIGEFNFFKYMPEVTQNRFTPFIYAGIGLVNYTPTATYLGGTYELRPLLTEGQSVPYKNSAIALPYGAGIKYNISGKWNFIADIGYRTTNTDYLDDVAGVYVSKAAFTDNIARALSDRSGERTGVYTGAAGTQRGDLRPRDHYMFIGLTLSYTFVTQKCYY